MTSIPPPQMPVAPSAMEDHCREGFDLVPDPIWILSGNRFVEGNQAALRTLGLAAKPHLLSVHPAEISPAYQPDGEDSYSKAERMIALTKEHGLHRFEWVHQRWDGTRLFMEVTARLITWNGQPAILCLWHDSSERAKLIDELKASDDRYKRLASTVPLLLYDYVMDQDGSDRFTYVGPRCRDILELDDKTLEADSRRFWDLLHPDDVQRFRNECLLTVREGRQAFASEVRLITPAGKLKWLEICSRARQPEAQGLPDWSGFMLDITERKYLEHVEKCRTHILTLLAKDSPLPTVLEAMARAVEALDPTMLCSVLLLDADGLHLQIGAAPSLPDYYNAMVQGLAIGPAVGSCGAAAFTGQRVIVENTQTHPNWANFRGLALRANLAACWSEPILSAKGQVLGTFAIYRQVPSQPTAVDLDLIEKFTSLAAIAIERSRRLDELLQYRQLLEQQVRTDPLTGIANRRALAESAEQVWRQSLRHGYPLALLMIDIDKFKAFNDQYGHLAGDACLRQVAQRLRECTRRAGDLIARYGGEEFVVLLADTTREQALTMAEMLRKAVLELNIPYAGAPFDNRVSVSIGVGAGVPNSRLTNRCDDDFTGHSLDSLESLVQLADAGLYRAKAAGRNLVCTPAVETAAQPAPGSE